MKKQKKNKYRSSRIYNLLNELDWDCKDQVHQFNSLSIVHWYPGSFISAIPGNIIEIFSEEGDIIWDPFCGSGITAVESFRMNRKFYGNDINEISTITTLAKLRLLEHFTEFIKHSEQFIDFIETKHTEIKFSKKSNLNEIKKNISFKDLKPWYSDRVLHELLCLYTFIYEYKIPNNIWVIYWAIFLNIARLSCAQQKTWGHIADNVVPIESQIIERKFDVFSSYINRIQQIIKKVNRIYIFPNRKQSYDVKTANIKNYSPNEKVDLVVTSPPYPLMNDYITSQRLAYYWLNIDKNKLNEIKKSEIGARFRRSNKTKLPKYYDDMVNAFQNIIGGLKSDAIMAIIMPNYNEDEPRFEYISKFYSFLENKMEKFYSVDRNIDMNNRWTPFKKLKSEKLTVWCKNG